jgi:hypothetical protein
MTVAQFSSTTGCKVSEVSLTYLHYYELRRIASFTTVSKLLHKVLMKVSVDLYLLP